MGAVFMQTSLTMCNQGYHLPQTPYQLSQTPPTCQPCGHIPYLIREASDSCGKLGHFNSPWKPWDSHTLRNKRGTLESKVPEDILHMFHFFLHHLEQGNQVTSTVSSWPCEQLQQQRVGPSV